MTATAAAVPFLTTDTWSNLLPAFGWFFAWTTLYFTLCLVNARKSYEWHVRCVTAVHAVLVCAMSAWSGFVLGPWPFTDPGGPMTYLEYITCNVCLGYFLFDFVWCTYFQTEGIVMLIHHSLSILGNVLIIYYGVSGTEMIATILGSELTNPFLQARWFLRELNIHKTWYGELNDCTFMLLFTYLRIGVGSSLLYWVTQHPNPSFIVKTGGVLHYIVGWAFFFQIIRYAFRKYRKMYREHQAAALVKRDDDHNQQFTLGVSANNNGKIPTSMTSENVKPESESNGVHHRNANATATTAE